MNCQSLGRRREGVERGGQENGLIDVAERAVVGFCQEQFGIVLRGVDTGVAQHGGCVTDHLFDKHHQLWRARRSASSAWMSESMTACRSPSSTWSRL